MTWMVSSARNVLGGTAGVVGSILDAPSNLLRTGAQRIWHALPLTNTETVQNFLNDQSLTTRTVAKAGAVAAGLTALTAAVPLAGWQIGAAAAIGLRAARITHTTGQELPADPKASLLETVQKISIFDMRRRPNREVAPVTLPPGPLSASMQTDKSATDRELQLLIQNASIFSTLTFIHTNRFGIDIDPKSMSTIIRETLAPKGNLQGNLQGNLWTSYMRHLGGQLNWHQKVRAAIWYFCSYTLGIIPNSIDIFITNVLRELREKLSDRDKICHLESGVNRLLEHTSLFLEAYNHAAKEYAEANNPSEDIDFYRHEAIKRLGGVSLHQLCKEFSAALIDEFFPRIPFFTSVKKSLYFRWPFEILDLFIGGFINYIGRWIIKRNLPITLQSLIEEGLDPTSPSNLLYTVKITETVSEILTDLEQSGMTHQTPPPFKPEKLPLVIDQLFQVLDLTGSKEDPLITQEQVRARLKNYAPGISAGKLWNQAKQRIFRNALQDSGHAMIGHVAENTEKIFARVLSRCNQSLQSDATVTLTDYNQAYATLEATANRALIKVVNTVLQGVPHDEQKRTFLEMYEQQRTNALFCSERFVRHANQIQYARARNESSLLNNSLNEYMQSLKTFVEASCVMQAETSTPEIKNAFYETFHPLFQNIPQLAGQVLHIQELQANIQQQSLAVQQWGQIANLLHQFRREPSSHLIANMKRHLPSHALESSALQARLEQLRLPIQDPITQANLNQLQRDIAAANRKYEACLQQTQADLTHQIEQLQQQSASVQAITAQLRPSRIEGNFFLASAAKGAAASAATPIVMDLFKRAYRLITTKGTYDAVGRIFMRSVVETYKR